MIKLDDLLFDKFTGKFYVRIAGELLELKTGSGPSGDYYTKAQVDNAIANIWKQGTIVTSVDDVAIVDGCKSDSVIAAASARDVNELSINLQALFDNLAGVAFIGEKPTWQHVISGAPQVNTYSITVPDDPNITVDDGNGNDIPSSIQEGDALTIRLVPTDGYSISVQTATMEDGTMPDPTNVNGVLTYTITSVTGPIVITALAEQVVTYNVRHHLLNMTNDGASTVEAGDDYTESIEKDDSNYTYNNDLRVFVDGVKLTADTDYSYSNGELSINAASITGDIDIIATAATDTITISTNDTLTIYINGTSHSLSAGDNQTIQGITEITQIGTTANANNLIGCTQLKSIDFGGAVLKKGTGNGNKYSQLFRNCTNLTSITGLVLTDEITDCTRFFDTSKVTSLDLSTWNVDNVTSFVYMFNGCSSMTSVVMPVRSDNGTVTITNMFNGCSSLQQIDMSGLRLTTTSINSLFANCSVLDKADIRGISGAITDIGFSFNNVKSNADATLTLTIGNFDLSLVSTNTINKMTNIGILICTTSTPPDDALFTYMTKLSAIYVPVNAESAYHNAWDNLIGDPDKILPITKYTE